MSGVGLGAGAWTNLNPLNSGQIMRGIYSMPYQSNSFTVSGLSIGTTNYVLQITISNIVDATIRNLVATVSDKTATSFTFETNQTTDHTNYKAEYLIIKL
jgi:short subunit dehydrogenase-like uncharacterized protein